MRRSGNPASSHDVKPALHVSLTLLAKRGGPFPPPSLPAIADLGRFGAAIPLIVEGESQKRYVVVPMAAASAYVSSLYLYSRPVHAHRRVSTTLRQVLAKFSEFFVC